MPWQPFIYTGHANSPAVESSAPHFTSLTDHRAIESFCPWSERESNREGFSGAEEGGGERRESFIGCTCAMKDHSHLELAWSRLSGTFQSQRGSRYPAVDSRLVCLPVGSGVGRLGLSGNGLQAFSHQTGRDWRNFVAGEWVDGVATHSKGLTPARTQGAREKGLSNLFIFIPSYPADLRFSYFTGHPGLIKIRFKNDKALEFWKGVELGYCVCETITSPTSCISLLSKMDLGRKSIKQQQLSKLLSLIWKRMDSQKGQAPKHYMQCIVLGNQNKHRKKKINSLSATYNFLVSNMCKYLWQTLLFSSRLVSSKCLELVD